jgi:mono/diheme cytochrome c family protein
MRRSRRILAFSLLALLLQSCAPSTGSKTGIPGGAGASASGDRAAGEEIYKMNCATCHGATGLEGGVVGPSLRHESERMGFGATVSWIEDPQAPMPHLYPKILTRQEVRDVSAYVNSL